VKTKNNKNLKVKALVDSRYTHMEIDEQLVKNKRIQTRPINFSFKVFNTDEMKNRKVTKVALLEIEINRHKEQLKATVMNLNNMDMFLGHDWLVKHNPEVNWKNGTIKFTRCPESCKMKHQNIEFKTRRTQAIETMTQDNGEIGKKSNKTTPEDLLDYDQLFTHLFNKKFEKLLEQQEWNHEINLTDEALWALNAKAYAMTIKEEELLNQ